MDDLHETCPIAYDVPSSSDEAHCMREHTCALEFCGSLGPFEGRSRMRVVAPAGMGPLGMTAEERGAGKVLNVVNAARVVSGRISGSVVAESAESRVVLEVDPSAISRAEGGFWDDYYAVERGLSTEEEASAFLDSAMPARSLAVRTVADVQAALKFAAEHNLQVSVKSGGPELRRLIDGAQLAASLSGRLGV